MTDETETPQTEQIQEQDLDPLESEGVSTEGFQGDQNGLLNGYVDRLRTAGTQSKLNLEDGKVLDIIVDDNGQILDKDGEVITIHPDPNEPIAHLMQEVKGADVHDNKTSKFVKIGVVTLAGLAAGISIARFISSHRPPQKK